MNLQNGSVFKHTRRAAYFLLFGSYFGRPLDDTVIRALLATGYEVDIFAPSLSESQTIYPSSVRLFSVEYRLSWLKKNVSRKRWKSYDLLLGTADLPMAVVGVLGTLTGRKTVTVCDEIYIGGYQGNANYYWKPMVRFGMRRSAFTVITDLSRVDLQRQYGGLPSSHKFVPVPCCFVENKFVYDAMYWKQKFGVREGACLLSISGHTSSSTGVHWAINALEQLSSRYQLLIQPGANLDPLLHTLLQQSSRGGRIVYVPGRSSFLEAMSLNQAADIGLVFYLSEKSQFQKMGVSSNKLCMYLQMGKPVVASRQESFRFLEDYGGGILIDSETELAEAVIEISTHYEKYSQAARKCFRDYVKPDQSLERLTQEFAKL